MKNCRSRTMLLAVAMAVLGGCVRQAEAVPQPTSNPLEDSTAVRLLRKVSPDARVLGWVDQGGGDTLHVNWSARDTVLPWEELDGGKQ